MLDATTGSQFEGVHFGTAAVATLATLESKLAGLSPNLKRADGASARDYIEELIVECVLRSPAFSLNNLLMEGLLFLPGVCWTRIWHDITLISTNELVLEEKT